MLWLQSLLLRTVLWSCFYFVILMTFYYVWLFSIILCFHSVFLKYYIFIMDLGTKSGSLGITTTQVIGYDVCCLFSSLVFKHLILRRSSGSEWLSYCSHPQLISTMSPGVPTGLSWCGIPLRRDTGYRLQYGSQLRDCRLHCHGPTAPAYGFAVDESGSS